MNSKIPVPTDNIYKFYALFGLLLFLSCVYAFVNLYQDYNQKAFKRYIDLKTLESFKTLDSNQSATKFVLEKQSKIDAADKEFFLSVIGGAVATSWLLMAYGFYQWHTKIQPQQDRMAEKQLEKADLEIKILKKEIRIKRGFK